MTAATNSKMGRFGRYVVVGLATNVSLYLSFLALVWLKVPPILASALCYVIGVTASYLLNRSWTFSSTSTHRLDMIRFAAAYGFGLCVTMSSMYLLVDPLGPNLAQLLTIGIAAISIFGLLELVRFGQ